VTKVADSIRERAATVAVAGAREIEITPQMIEAGLDAYAELALDLDEVPRDRVVSDIFRAMAKAFAQEKAEACGHPQLGFQGQ
jgi:hypothetical protein